MGGLILDSPLCSAAHMARLILPLPGIGKALALKLDNLARIGRMRCPMLVLHGDRDGVIPLKQDLEVFETAPQPKSPR